MSLRQLLFSTLTGDPQLNLLGIDSDSTYPNFAPDSPAALHARWLVIRWGVASPPPGRDAAARPEFLSLWAYDRERDFGGIEEILKRSRVLLDGLAGVRYLGGAVLACDWSESSEDLFDAEYGAVARSETYRVVASGI